jgi:hypothetical protein
VAIAEVGGLDHRYERRAASAGRAARRPRHFRGLDNTSHVIAVASSGP